MGEERKWTKDESEQLTRIEGLLKDALDRMDNARSLLRKQGNWGMLDTTRERAVLAELDRPRYRDDLPVMASNEYVTYCALAGGLPLERYNIRVLIPVDVEKRLEKAAWDEHLRGDSAYGVAAYLDILGQLRDRWVDTGEVPE